MRFTDFIGNEKIKEQLITLAEGGRLPHAIVLEGEEGIGKRTLARELVLNLFCKGEGERPCRSCPQCRKVLKGIHPDVYEYTAPNRPAAFHVETVREVREDAFMKPNEADYKVYLLGNAQSMTVSSQNALLKVLEEPPAYAVFILTVTNKSRLLETVLSRSVAMSLEGVEPTAAAERICALDSSADYSEALRAAELCNGNIGKALETLGDGRLSAIGGLADRMARALIQDHEYDLLICCAAFNKDRETMLAVLSQLKAIFRDALVGTADSVSGQRDTAALLASRVSRDKLLQLIDVCDRLRSMAERNGNNAILLTKICADLRSAIGR